MNLEGPANTRLMLNEVIVYLSFSRSTAVFIVFAAGWCYEHFQTIVEKIDG